jgi:peptidoglycan/xylan/chitin deacetylase (PgdA/CDA1 family)
MATVALTFDDGPSQWTLALLDVLAKHDAHVTFFVLGQQIAGHEETLKRAHAEGHELAVHGWDHKPVADLTAGALLAQVETTALLLEDLTGVEPRWWRPPWNRAEGKAVLKLAGRGFSFCGVTLDGRDVSHGEDAIVATVLRGLREGAIVGLHDGIAPNGESHLRDRMGTVRAVDRILERCRSVTVSELLGVRVGT